MFIVVFPLPYIPFAVYFRELRIRACSALLICSFWYFLSSFLCFSYYEIVCRLLLARKIGCRSQVNSFLLTTSREKAKKTWGKRGRTGGGGGIIALSYSTVLPHIDWGIKMCSCVFVYFFFSSLYCTLKKRELCWCITIIILIKFFWFDLIWSLAPHIQFKATVLPHGLSLKRGW